MDELTVLERVRLLLIELEESRRILVCRPEHEAAVRAALAELCSFEHLIEVRVDDWVPEGQFLLIDPNAIEAASRAAVQRPPQIIEREPWRRPCGCMPGMPCVWHRPQYVNEQPDPRKLVIITGI